MVEKRIRGPWWGDRLGVGMVLRVLWAAAEDKSPGRGGGAWGALPGAAGDEVGGLTLSPGSSAVADLAHLAGPARCDIQRAPTAAFGCWTRCLMRFSANGRFESGAAGCLDFEPSARGRTTAPESVAKIKIRF